MDIRDASTRQLIAELSSRPNVDKLEYVEETVSIEGKSKIVIPANTTILIINTGE